MPPASSLITAYTDTVLMYDLHWHFTMIDFIEISQICMINYHSFI